MNTKKIRPKYLKASKIRGNLKRYFSSIMVLLMLFTAFITIDTTVLAQEENKAPEAADMTIDTEKNTAVEGTLTAIDPEDDTLVFEIVTQPSKGTVSLDDAAMGKFTYTPNEGAEGEDSFGFKANDGTQDSNTATVKITIKDTTEQPEEPGEPEVPEEPEQPVITFPYKDLLTHWAHYPASKLAEKGIVVGQKIRDKYYFDPDKVMNRAEFLLFVSAALQLDLDDPELNDIKFADEANIPHWVIMEAKAARKARVMNGSQEGEGVYFHPFGELTRIETIMVLNNAINPDAENKDPLTFADTDQIPLWAVQAVKNMKGYGIIGGYDDNTIRPFNKVTRAEAAQMLYQVIKYKESQQTAQTFTNKLANTLKGFFGFWRNWGKD